jgi:hypothetical protein
VVVGEDATRPTAATDTPLAVEEPEVGVRCAVGGARGGRVGGDGHVVVGEDEAAAEAADVLVVGGGRLVVARVRRVAEARRLYSREKRGRIIPPEKGVKRGRRGI